MDTQGLYFTVLRLTIRHYYEYEYPFPRRTFDPGISARYRTRNSLPTTFDPSTALYEKPYRGLVRKDYVQAIASNNGRTK
eukprot:scaffold206059_cov14-Prasinocladus_malaysianus.AAC.1